MKTECLDTRKENLFSLPTVLCGVIRVAVKTYILNLKLFFLTITYLKYDLFLNVNFLCEVFLLFEEYLFNITLSYHMNELY